MKRRPLPTGMRKGDATARASARRLLEARQRCGAARPAPADPRRPDDGRSKLAWSPILSLTDFVRVCCRPISSTPLNYNPLRDLVEQSIDFEVLRGRTVRSNCSCRATNVRTGKIKISPRKSPRMRLLASACLPTCSAPSRSTAKPIGTAATWKSGDLPLIYHCESAGRRDRPGQSDLRARRCHDGGKIMNRVNEISFNSSLMREMRAINFVTGLVTQKRVVDGEVKHVLVHSIADDEFMGALSPTSKYNADWDFLIYLKNEGRKCAGEWLAQNFAKLGVESSVDAEKVYRFESRLVGRTEGYG